MSGSDWTPVHHVEADDSDNEPAKGPTVSQREGKTKEDKGTPVGLTLNLPPEFISAVWANSDQVLRLAMAVEENTKVMREVLKGSKNDTTGPVSDGANPS